MLAVSATCSINFNSRPSARGDGRCTTTAKQTAYFNSRPSARGDGSKMLLKTGIFISIHAPPRGATTTANCNAKSAYFNSRPSARGDLIYSGRQRTVTISIHAPPRGATLDVVGRHVLRDQFQFTPLREGRRGAVLFPAHSHPISIHAPPRGATLSIRFFHVSARISIHAPPRGATETARRASASSSISIHAPPRGATGRWAAGCCGRYFNSRPSARGDWKAHSLKEGDLFQFTPLREGRQEPGDGRGDRI